MFEHPRKCILGAFDQSETNTIDFYTIFWSRNRINYNENTIHEHNPSFNGDSQKNVNFDQS